MIQFPLTIKHVIFDLDGTLTVKIHDFQQIRKQLGVPENQDILTWLSLLEPDESLRLHVLLHDIETALAMRSSPSEGAEALVGMLYEKGVNMGILTRNTRENTHITLEKIQLAGYFKDECILGRENIRPKPDPDGIFKLLTLWKGSPQHTLMVGDFLYDLQAGKNAGTFTAHIDRDQIYPWTEFADIQVPSLKALMKFLQSNLTWM